MAQSAGEGKADRTARIVGGKPSPSGRWPAMVALVNKGSTLFNGQFCGGTIIDKRWVLTAAHCVFGRSANSIQVATGLTDLNGPATELINVTRIVQHPQYNNRTLNNDFALLALQTLTGQPIASLYGGSSDLSGLIGTAVGWGATNASGTSFTNDLMEVDMPIVSNTQCESLNQDGTTAQMLCAGDLAGQRDACGGDSGGPLFISLMGRTVQAGVTSFGLGFCANPDAYGVWARVSSGSAFILNHVPSARILTEQLIRQQSAVAAPVSLLLD
ncbi:MAG: serine protease [Acidiferrobacterales bacterium]|nr:serine protease [Acidiferrobacterales bacterium]